MAAKNKEYRPPSRFTVDWMVAASVVIALALVAGSLLPVPRHAPSGGLSGRSDIHVLSINERLLVYEDYGSNVGAWANAQRFDRSTVIGSVVRPVSDAPLVRRFDLPEGATRLTLMFHVIISAGDAWPVAEVAGRQIAAERQILTDRFARYLIAVEDPGAALTLSVTRDGNRSWALDNLIAVVTLPESGVN